MEPRRPTAEQSGCRRWRSGALLAALLILGMGLAACGGGGSPSGALNPAGSAIPGCSPSGCSSPAASATAEAMAVTFSGCMRSHGVSDFRDPTIGSNGLPSWTSSENNPGPSYRTAQRACRKDLPSLAPHTSAQKATANAAALRYATCMRSGGVPDFPDPNGQGLIEIPNATGALEESSPQFQKAATDCKSLDNGFAEQSSSAVASPSPGAGASP